MAAILSTHVLDIAHGHPARGMKLELWRLDAGERKLIATATTNAEGRTEKPLLAVEKFRAGQYEIIFFVGDYFTACGTPLPKPVFLDQVPVRFNIANDAASYHVPLLCSPWSYSTYRGS